MNEIKKIHLDRQPFTISIEAHRELRAYLDAIERQVGPKGQDVLKEIELRMAELLTERGVTAEKVVLAEDVEFLKEQLGKPGDFKDEGGEARSHEDRDETSAHDNETFAEGSGHDEQPKRLYRDPENAMIAGVASGLAAYFRIDPLIVRLLFVVLTLTGGAGIITYILLWILVPEAKSPSERLQMRGKAVTVDNIKRLVDRADLPAAANRTGTLIGRILAGIAKVFLAIIGVILTITGVAAVLWSFITATYWLVHGRQIGADVAFPVGTNEVIFLVAGLVTAVTAGLMLALVGIAMITRKWRVPAWATASIAGLFFVGATVGTALAFDTFPSIRQRYRDAHKTQTRSLTEFKNLELRGEDTNYVFKPSDDYSVSLKYVGKLDTKNVTTKVEGDTLKIDTSSFGDQRFCSGPCFYSLKTLEVTIYAPAAEHISFSGEDASFKSSEALRQDSMVIDTEGETTVKVSHIKADEARLAIRNSGARTLQLQNIQGNEAAREDTVALWEEGSRISQVDELHVELPHNCDTRDPIVFVNNSVKTLHVNDSDAVQGIAGLGKLQDSDKSNDYNCIAID